MYRVGLYRGLSLSFLFPFLTLMFIIVPDRTNKLYIALNGTKVYTSIVDLAVRIKCWKNASSVPMAIW